MGTFLGNHDVARFIAQASGEISSLYGDSACGDDGALRTPDTAPEWDEPYRRLMLAWTFLLTNEGLPLVYYGDEIGLPGYNDPDNRQPMRFGDDLSVNEQRVLDHVRALGQGRLAHPALSTGTRTAWWSNEAGFLAYARVTDDDAALVLINRDASDRTVSNGVAFAGLPEGRYVDLLTGDTFDTSGDSLTVDVPALDSRVLVPE
jgi:glycosidase